MGKKPSALSSQLSAQKLIIFSAILFAITLAGVSLLKPSAFGGHPEDRGTLTIPERAGKPALDSTASDALSVRVEKLKKQLGAIKDIKGSFVQKSYIKDLEDTQEYAGTFYIKKPANMMWEYAAPRDEKVLINDTETYIYKKSRNQVIKTTFTKESYSQVPIAMLASLDSVEDDFEITLQGENALQLIPRRKIGFIKSLVLETASADMPVKMFTIFDTYGNIIMIELADVRTNPGLDDSLFTFTLPPGAEVYDMSQ